MRETLRFLVSPIRGLQGAVYILAAFALFSSLLALVRDRLFAHVFGAGTELDLYYAAFRIPDFLFVALGALVSVYILIPELVRRNSEEQKAYIDTVIVGFSALSFVAATATALFAPQILTALFPQFVEAGHLSTLSTLTRVMLLQPILLGASNILAAITQVKQRYTLYAISPVLYNAGIICGILFFYPLIGIQGLAWGVVLGALLHCTIQLPSIVGDGFFRRVPRLYDTAALLRTVVVSIPRALALSMNQVTVLGLTALASLLSAGSITVFMFGFNLMNVPLAIIGASYSVVAFPTLASALSGGRTSEFIEYVSAAARYILFWSLPVTALLLVLRAHIVRVILGSGSFDWTDTRLTAAIFALLSLSLTAQALMLLFARANYAAGRTFVPFFVSLGTAFSTLGLTLVFLESFKNPATLQFVERIMRIESVPGSAVLALPLSFALLSILGTLVLMLHFELRFGGLFSRIRTTFLQGALSAIGGAAAAYTALFALGPLSLTSTLLSVFLKGFVAGLAGIAGVTLIYMLLPSREFNETVGVMHERLWRRRLAPGQPIASAEEISSSSPQ